LAPDFETFLVAVARIRKQDMTGDRSANAEVRSLDGLALNATERANWALLLDDA
jgi:hypothetical protein